MRKVKAVYRAVLPPALAVGVAIVLVALAMRALYSFYDRVRVTGPIGRHMPLVSRGGVKVAARRGEAVAASLCGAVEAAGFVVDRRETTSVAVTTHCAGSDGVFSGVVVTVFMRLLEDRVAKDDDRVRVGYYARGHRREITREVWTQWQVFCEGLGAALTRASRSESSFELPASHVSAGATSSTPSPEAVQDSRDVP